MSKDKCPEGYFEIEEGVFIPRTFAMDINKVREFAERAHLNKALDAITKMAKEGYNNTTQRTLRQKEIDILRKIGYKVTMRYLTTMTGFWWWKENRILETWYLIEW